MIFGGIGLLGQLKEFLRNLGDSSGTGILAREADGSVNVRTLEGGDGITVSNGDGSSGNPSIAFDGSTVDDIDGSAGDILYYDGSDWTANTRILAGPAVESNAVAIGRAAGASGADSVAVGYQASASSSQEAVFGTLMTEGGGADSTRIGYSSLFLTFDGDGASFSGIGTFGTTVDVPALVVQDGDDPTKEAAFDVSGVTTSTTRTLTVQDSDGTIALTSDIPTSPDRATDKLQAIQTISDDTWTDVMDVSGLDDDKYYAIRVHVVATAHEDDDIEVRFSVPGGASLEWVVVGGKTAPFQNRIESHTATISTDGQSLSGVVILLEGTLRDSPSLKLQMRKATDSTANNLSMYDGSKLIAEEI